MYTVYSLETYEPVFQFPTLAQAIEAVTHCDWLFCYYKED